MKSRRAKQPKYKIKNTFLPTGVIERTIFGTLDMYLRDEDLSESPLVQWGRRTLKRGAWWYGVQKMPPEKWESLILKRQQKVIDLYLNIKNHGYNGSVISIFFDDNGNICTYDGFHRLSIMKYLGMEVLLNCQISTRKSDFSLVETVMDINNGKNLYQPCDDVRLKDFNVWRKDSSERLKFILENISGKTVLDIGCSEGYFSRELTKNGYQVTALDTSKKRLAVTRYLSIINNLELNYYRGRWQDYIEDKDFETILFLSIFHHDILNFGLEEAFKQLEKFRGRAKQVFFESPISSKKVGWIDEERKTTYGFSEEAFKTKIEEATNMIVTKTWHGIRPIFLLVA